MPRADSARRSLGEGCPTQCVWDVFADVMAITKCRAVENTPSLTVRRMAPIFRGWIEAKAGAEKLPLHGYWTLPARDLWQTGYRRRADDRSGR